MYNCSLLIQDVTMKTYRERLTIETSGGRESEISVPAVRYAAAAAAADDDDDDDYSVNETLPLTNLERMGETRMRSSSQYELIFKLFSFHLSLPFNPTKTSLWK